MSYAVRRLSSLPDTGTGDRTPSRPPDRFPFAAIWRARRTAVSSAISWRSLEDKKLCEWVRKPSKQMSQRMGLYKRTSWTGLCVSLWHANKYHT